MRTEFSVLLLLVPWVSGFGKFIVLNFAYFYCRREREIEREKERERVNVRKNESKTQPKLSIQEDKVKYAKIYC